MASSTLPQTSVEQMFVTAALKSWQLWRDRLSKRFDSLSDEQMMIEIAPGKNRPYYLLGHLIAVNDAMLDQMGIGQGQFAQYREPFLTKPDRAGDDLPSVQVLRQNWRDLNPRLDAAFEQLSPSEWLQKHALVSEEDFAREPHRNRLSILHSRTSHNSYHLGQLVLVAK